MIEFEIVMAFGPLAAAITGGASLLGGIMSDKASAKEASKSRQFTAEQMKNKHQWETEDLEKAGLNRILSATNNPSIGSSAMGSVTDKSNIGSKALEGLMAKAQLDNIKADTANKASSAKNQLSQSKLTDISATRKGVTQPIFDALGETTKKTLPKLADKDPWNESPVPVVSMALKALGFSSAKSNSVTKPQRKP